MSEDQVSPYTGVVLAVDPARVDHAALAVTTVLGAGTGGIELLTVVPTGAPRHTSEISLEQIAQIARLPDATCTVRSSSRPAEVLLEAAGRDKLLVAGCAPGHPALTPRLGDVGRAVLRRAETPVLIVGPSVAGGFEEHGQLIVCARGTPQRPALAAADRWSQTFHPSTTWVAGVIPTSVDVGDEGTTCIGEWADGLRRRGLEPRERLLTGGDPVTWLEDFSAGLASAVYVVTSERYTDGRRHFHSTARDLIARSRHPVLVVPGRPTPGADGATAGPGLSHGVVAS